MEEQQRKIDARDAVQRAAKYYQEVTNDYNQVSVAEVELSEDGNFWLITLMHRLQSTPFTTLSDNWGYKVLTINAENGEVLSMKIRTVK
jgi:hypothetical protein